MRILLIGCGKMGGALLDGWLARGTDPADIVVVEPSEAARAARPAIRSVGSIAAVPADFHPDVVALAIKPQQMDAALPDLARIEGGVLLSIAAGRTLDSFARALGDARPVVRAMPNTPAAVRAGMIVAVANAHVSAAQRRACTGLLEAVGAVEWIEDEGWMDAVTALSGSGPAYVFLLAEAMAEAGEAAGLPADFAARLARETVIGSAQLLRGAPESPAQLRKNVTSPGGTTFAALEVLMGEDGVNGLMRRAVAAAARRSRELAG